MGSTGVDTVEKLRELIDKHAFDLTQQLDVNTRFLTYLTKSHLLSPSELLQFQRYESQTDRVRTILKILPDRDKPNASFAFIESLRQSGQEDLAVLLMGGKSEVDVISHYQSSLQLQFHEIKSHLKSEVSELKHGIADPENGNASSTRVLLQFQNITESTIKQLENCEQILDRLHEDCLKIAKANIDMLRKIETVDSTIRSVLDVGRRSYFPKKKAFPGRAESTQPNNTTDHSVNISLGIHSKYNYSGRKLQETSVVTRRPVAKISTGGEYIKTSDFRTCVQISEKLLKEIKEGLKSETNPQYGTKLLVAGKETSFKYQSRVRPVRRNQTFGAKTSIPSKVGLKNILLERLMEIDSNFHSYANRLKRSSKGRGLNANKPLVTGNRSRPLNESETVVPKKKTSKGVQTDNSMHSAQEERKIAERASQIAKSLDQRNNDDLVKILDQMHRTITERIVSLTSNLKLSRRSRPLSAGQESHGDTSTHRSSAINNHQSTKMKYDYRAAGNQRTVVLLRDFSRELKAYTELELQLSEAILNEKRKTSQKEEIIKIRDNELKSFKQIVTAIESERDTFKRLYERANKSIPLKPIRVDPRRHGAKVPEQTPTNVSEEHEKPEAEQKHPVVTVDV
ncbi:unnamed protein product [Owenia fusiformis]|uniref:CARD domain-containing protein n=1 Tax=Owenia fusiformis TaxID=6347 RepID=A0A8S4N442_OWEFU|nr:unnamed protein product [Owenia fusiformis]